MLTKIQKWGNNLGLRIPRSFAAEAQVEEGSPVDLSVENGRLLVRPLRTRKYALNALLKWPHTFPRASISCGFSSILKRVTSRPPGIARLCDLRQGGHRGDRVRFRHAVAHRRRRADPGRAGLCDGQVAEPVRDPAEVRALPRAVGAGHRRVLDLLLPRAQARRCLEGGAG